MFEKLLETLCAGKSLGMGLRSGLFEEVLCGDAPSPGGEVRV